jgi:hypothetical protein
MKSHTQLQSPQTTCGYYDYHLAGILQEIDPLFYSTVQ